MDEQQNNRGGISNPDGFGFGTKGKTLLVHVK